MALCILTNKAQTKTYCAIKTNYLSETTERTSSDTIKFNLIGTDSHYASCSLKLSDITILVNGTKVTPEDMTLGTITPKANGKGVTALLTLVGVPGEGQLSIKIAAGTLKDLAGNTNPETRLDTEVIMYKPVYAAAAVKRSPSSYYGKTVNYSANGVTDWKVFYADNSNIFLITSDYLSVDKVPSGAKMTTTGTYQAYWASAPTAQTVTSLNSSFMFTGYNDYSSYTNGKCVSTLLNVSNWSNFVNTSYADYAIGGATVEMWFESWNNIYTNELIYCNNTGTYGYYVGTENNPKTVGIALSAENASAGNLYFPHYDR